MHVNLDQYFLALRGVLPWELLLQQAHRHLLDLCAVCRSEWDGTASFVPAEQGSRPRPLPDGSPPPLPVDRRTLQLRWIDPIQRHLSRLRGIARRAREDLARLRKLPREVWPETVRSATSRFRSRAFVHLLIEAARAVVRNDPHEAAALTALVPVALDQVPGRESLEWARGLRLRAAAHHANALRVAGDLRAADRALAELRPQLAAMPLEPEIAAEIASLEASLRIGQRRFAEADDLLAAACEALGPRRLDARLLIKRANLQRSMGRPELALDSFERAAATLETTGETTLHPVTVSGRVNCLCELDRYEEAGRLLAAERAAFAIDRDDHAAALHGFYTARIALGLGRFAAAVEGFATARDRLLALGRDFDAILACLYLADALLSAGRTAELRDLAAGLVPLFRSRGVQREALASLRLLAEAVRKETLTAAVLAEIRQELQRSPAPIDLPAPVRT
jgi:tetratricopeptide (TPR) repeat protein